MRLHQPVFAFGIWTFAVALALGAQRLLTPPGRVETGAILYGVAATLAVVGVFLIDRHAPRASPVAGVPPPPASAFAPSRMAASGWRSIAPPRLWPPWLWPKGRLLSLGLALVGVAVVAYATYLVAANQSPELANALWAVGLGYLVLCVWSGRGGRSIRPRLDRRLWTEVAVVVAILALALALRLPDLAEIPPMVHGDEGQMGLWARKLLSGEIRSIFGVGWSSFPMLSFVPSALSMRLFGDDLFGLRVASVAQGTLSVLLLYLLIRRLFSARIAAIAAFLLAVSQLAIHYNRVGLNNVQAEVAVLLLFYLFVEAVERRSIVLYLLAGFAAGYCLEVYSAARIAPPIAGLYVLHRWASEHSFLARQWRGLLVVAFGAILFVAPFVAAYARTPQALVGRAETVFVLSEANLKHEYGAYKVSTPAEVLVRQVVYTLEAFNLRGETSLNYGRRAPLLDFSTSALFVLGVAVATARPRRTPCFFVAAWLWLTLLLGSVLTVNALFSPHIVVAIPALFVFVALVVDAGWRGASAAFGRTGHVAFLLVALVFAAVAARDNYHEYFEVYVTQQQPADFYTTLSRYALSVNDRYQVYLLGKPATSLHYDTVSFLAPDVDGVDVRDKVPELPVESIPQSKGIAFVVEAAGPNAPAQLDAIRRAYPEGTLQAHTTPRGILLFTTYVVEPAELRAALPASVQAPAEQQSSQAPSAGAPTPGTSGQSARSLPPLPIDGLVEPRAVAVDRAGTIYVLDRGVRRVVKFDATGRRLGDIPADEGAPLPEDPRAIALGAHGEVLVLDARADLVRVYSRDGRQMGTLAIPGAYSPNGLAIDHQDRVLVADTGQNQIVRLSPYGGEPTTFGRTEAPPGRLGQPADVAVGPDGELFVVDTDNSRLAVFGPDLVYRREWPIPPSDTLNGSRVAVWIGRVVVSDTRRRKLLVYDLTGRVIAELGDPATVRPIGVFVDPAGTVYVADPGARRIFRYDIARVP